MINGHANSSSCCLQLGLTLARLGSLKCVSSINIIGIAIEKEQHGAEQRCTKKAQQNVAFPVERGGGELPAYLQVWVFFFPLALICSAN